MLKQILGEFLKTEGVSAAVVVGRDGFVIESAASGKMDIDALGAMASTGLGTSEAMGKELGKGELRQMLVELDQGPILISPLSPDELIAIVATNEANIGRIRYELKKIRTDSLQPFELHEISKRHVPGGRRGSACRFRIRGTGTFFREGRDPHCWRYRSLSCQGW